MPQNPEQPPTESPIASSMPITRPALCNEGYCQDAEPSGYELTETMESLVKKVLDGCKMWDGTIEVGKARARAYLGRCEAIEADIVRHTALKASRSDRRTANGPDSGQRLARARSEADSFIVSNYKRLMQQDTGPDKAPFLLSNEKLVQHLNLVEKFVGSVRAEQTPKIVVVGTPMTNPFAEVFLAEHVARGRIALTARYHPQLVYDMFAPDNLGGLPPATQRFAAADIQRGLQDSVILNLLPDITKNEKGIPTAQQAVMDNNRIREYLGGELHSPRAAGLMRAIQLGACALGSPVCAANAFGLCAALTDRIGFEGLPDEVRKDIKQAEDKAGAYRVSRLRAFADQPQVAVSKWWRGSEKIESQPAQQSHAPFSKGKAPKKPKRTPTPDLEEGLAARLEDEEHTNQLLVVSWKGSAETREIPPDAVDEQSLAVASIVRSKEFAAYIEKHGPGEALTAFVSEAIRRILFTNTYTDELAIKRLETKKPYRDNEGNPLQPFQLSGQIMNWDGSASKIGKETRFFFGMEGTSDARRVHIVGIRHKSDVVKLNLISGKI